MKFKISLSKYLFKLVNFLSLQTKFLNLLKQVFLLYYINFLINIIIEKYCLYIVQGLRITQYRNVSLILLLS